MLAASLSSHVAFGEHIGIGLLPTGGEREQMTIEVSVH